MKFFKHRRAAKCTLPDPSKCRYHRKLASEQAISAKNLNSYLTARTAEEATQPNPDKTTFFQTVAKPTPLKPTVQPDSKLTFPGDPYPWVVSSHETGIACKKLTLTPEQMVDSFDGRKIAPQCEHFHFPGEDGLITPQATLGADPDNLHKMEWWHITTRENWEQETTSNPDHLIHAGTFAAALMRAKTLTNMADKNNKPAQFYLHRLHLKPDTPVAARVFEDLIDEWPTTRNEIRTNPNTKRRVPEHIETPVLNHMFEADGVTRYINDSEDPGSMSILGSTDRFIVSKPIKIPSSFTYQSVKNQANPDIITW